MNNLASIWRKLNKLDLAEKMIKECIEIRL
jgi:hypothetical protein